MESYDVLIVGGGPAGSSCAWKLKDSGLRVGVLDKRSFPRDKVCAGWITPAVVQCLTIDVDDYRGQCVFQPITGFRTGVIGGREVETAYDIPISFGIRRCEFDHYLLKRCGADQIVGEPLRKLERDDRGWTINERYRTDMLVGAGGHFCPVAKHLGASRAPGITVVAAQEVEFEIPENERDCVHVRGEYPELFFCPDTKGYGWCFRKGNYLNIGLGRVDKQSLSDHVNEFTRFLKGTGKLGCRIPTRFVGHAYRLYEREVPKLVDDRVVLIGDSAGLAYPQSGEGIRPAVESGLMAAHSILAADGGYTKQALADYDSRIAARFGRPRAGSASDWLPDAIMRVVAARLLSSKWFAKRIVLERWFLHNDVPALTP